MKTAMTIKEFMNNREVTELSDKEQYSYDLLSLTLKYTLLFIVGAKFMPYAIDMIHVDVSAYISQFKSSGVVEAFKVR